MGKLLEFALLPLVAHSLLSPPGGGQPRRNFVGEEPLLNVPIGDAPAPLRLHGGRPDAPQNMLAAFSGFQAKWFAQRVDHFSRDASPAKFDQKYYVDSSQYDPANGPVLLYINGEAPLYAAPSMGTFTGVLARKLKALVVALEHRYYGDSQPFGDVSTSSLRYLNTAQALLDLRNFRLEYDRISPPSKPRQWVVIGGSYAGTLAAWFRARFPSLVAAAHASSAPIEAIDNYTQFDQQIQVALPSDCKTRVRRVNAHMESLLDGSAEQAAQLKQQFDATQLTNDDFAYLAADAVAIAVQYGQKGKLCDRLKEADLAGADDAAMTTAFSQYASAVFYPTLETGKPEAYETAYLRQNDTSKERNARQWLYQQCTELGWFQVHPDASPETALRLRHVDRRYFDNLCTGVFGRSLRPDTESTRRNYHGVDLAQDLNASRIFFTFGRDDPWQSAWPGSQPFSTDASAVASGGGAGASLAEHSSLRKLIIDCDDCAHCVDLGQVNPFSSPDALVAARNAVVVSMQEWLSAAESEANHA